MPDLVARAEVIAAEAEKKRDKERAQEELGRFREAVRQLDMATTKAASLARLLRALVQAGMPPVGFVLLQEDLRRVLGAIEAQDWEDLDPVAFDNAAREAAESVSELIASGRIQIQKMKDEWVAGESRIGESVLRALRPLAPERVEATQAAAEAADEVASRDVDDEGDVRVLIETQARLRACIDELLAEVELPSAVQDFLEQVGTRGFPLSQMPDEVLTWLREKEAAESFVVTVR